MIPAPMTSQHPQPIRRSHLMSLCRCVGLLCLLASGRVMAEGAEPPTAGATASQRAVISLKERVSTNQSLVTLGDVAEITSTSAEFREQLLEIPLGPGPSMGRPMMVDQVQVHQRLVAMGVNLSQVEYSGSGRTVLSFAATAEDRPAPVIQQVSKVEHEPRIRIDRGKINAMLVEAFKKEFRWGEKSAMPAVGIEPHEETPPAIWAALAAGGAVRFQADQLEDLPEQWVNATVETTAGGAPLPVKLKIRFTPQLKHVAFRRAMQKGEIVQQADLMWQTSSPISGGYTDPAQVIGMECRRAFKSGEFALAADLAAAPLVRNGDIVTASLRVKGIVIRGQYKSLSTAARGESVTLVSLDDVRERVSAVVTGWHEATITSTVPENAGMSPRGVQLVNAERIAEPGPTQPAPSQAGRARSAGATGDRSGEGRR